MTPEGGPKAPRPLIVLIVASFGRADRVAGRDFAASRLPKESRVRKLHRCGALGGGLGARARRSSRLCRTDSACCPVRFRKLLKIRQGARHAESDSSLIQLDARASIAIEGVGPPPARVRGGVELHSMLAT